MHVIALLLTISAAAQTPPPVAPPPLEEGEEAYEIKVDDDTWWYVSGFPRDLKPLEGVGRFKSDELEEKFPGRTEMEFLEYNIVSRDRRDKRWRDDITAWYESHGYVFTDLADGNGWIKQEDKQRADRARTAAKQVMEVRESRESLAIAGPTLNAPDQSETAPEVGLLQLWGPQIAVGVLAVVLMGVVARVFFMPDGTGWQKLE
jgi:hypothetical protein